QGRFSDRVAFGTGPAMIKGKNGNWDSYPFYNENIFKEIEETFSLFGDLFENDIETPMSEFLRNAFKTNDLWSPLRKNYKSVDKFIHACTVKVDGLKILQYLRLRQQNLPQTEYVIEQSVRDVMYAVENRMRRIEN
ncbi:hypothetical protein LJC73_06665, partial [Bacteroidales bacterium OttesenSCG-928-L14]|nr:hypothetical protein [Bacteroidales bacterium OttesenSCG-928-L14]